MRVLWGPGAGAARAEGCRDEGGSSGGGRWRYGRFSVILVSPTVLTAPGREQNCCFSTYLALKTAFYSFSGSKQAL